MEWSLHDLSAECAEPWSVEPGGREAEYDPGSLSLTPPTSMGTELAPSTEYILDNYSFYQPSIRPVAPVPSIVVDHQGICPNTAQSHSVNINVGERSKIDQAANYDSLRSQQLPVPCALKQFCSPRSKAEKIRPPGWTEKIK
jgi:hypothetical protein